MKTLCVCTISLFTGWLKFFLKAGVSYQIATYETMFFISDQLNSNNKYKHYFLLYCLVIEAFCGDRFVDYNRRDAVLSHFSLSSRQKLPFVFCFYTVHLYSPCGIHYSKYWTNELVVDRSEPAGLFVVVT